MTENQDDEIIELTEIADDSRFQESASGSFETDVIELDDAVSGEDDFQEPLPVQSSGEPDLPDLPSDMIESALERVIEKKFSGKIETILFEVMERMIEKEIKEIKENLQKDLDQIGSD